MFTDLRLQHFRSYKDASFEFQPGVNIIVGPNASGKTNLLEALLVLASGSSYRAKDMELVTFDEEWARLDSIIDSDRIRTLKFSKVPLPKKTYEIDGKPFQRLSLSHKLPIVLFEPNHLQLLTGPPENRRTYLDDLLEQTQPGYGSLRRQYKRTLAQRNALLKTGFVRSDELFPWNIRLSHLAGQIIRSRCELMNELQKNLPDLYTDISKRKTVITISYVSPLPIETYESHLLRKLEASQELDQQRGFTTCGPHREDFLVTYDGHATQESASRGETRTGVLALKILELQILEASRGIKPVLLLDDVFSELDGSRRKALTEYIASYQTFITTTDADILEKHFIESSFIMAVN